jgi:DNA-binding transcriptional ArsR family regulator
MEISRANNLFAALAQETRLNIVRLLITTGPAGRAAGELAERLAVPAPTLSFHLNHLASAGLVSSRRESRSIIYRVEMDTVRHLIDFLVEDCCEGDPAHCGDLVCAPKGGKRVHAR